MKVSISILLKMSVSLVNYTLVIWRKIISVNSALKMKAEFSQMMAYTTTTVLLK